MKRYIRFVSLVLALSLILAIPAYAAEGRAMEASNYISYTNAYLSKVSGTTFNICFHVTGTDTMDEIGVSYIQLQVSSDNSSWSPLASYYKSSNSDMYAENTSVHADHITYTGTTNMYYRAYVEFYAKDDTGTGYYSTHTTSIKVP